jgi:prepilin-type N-terminal cleavage/methylation domain-containing protein
MLRSAKGFTLIELLIVVVIIGILAAIAIPKFANTKEKAYLSAVKSDLRNIATAEEAYFADNLTYTTASTSLDYNTSKSVTVTLDSGDGTGWGATGTHSGLPAGITCALYYGDATHVVAPATLEGVVECNN